MKKKYMIAIVIGVLLLAGLILVLTLGKDKEKTGKDNAENDVIVHETDENTVEEKAEGGLKESDSEDGPVLDEDNMIDFNGSDAQPEDGNKPAENQGNGSNPDSDPSDGSPSDGADNTGDGDDTGEEPSEGEEEEEDSEDTEDTGSWGRFY